MKTDDENHPVKEGPLVCIFRCVPALALLNNLVITRFLYHLWQGVEANLEPKWVIDLASFDLSYFHSTTSYIFLLDYDNLFLPAKKLKSLCDINLIIKQGFKSEVWLRHSKNIKISFFQKKHVAISKLL